MTVAVLVEAVRGPVRVVVERVGAVLLGLESFGNSTRGGTG
jgi:hypothetical protein